MIAITAYQIIMVVRKLFLIQPSIHPKKTKSYLLAINLLHASSLCWKQDVAIAKANVSYRTESFRLRALRPPPAPASGG